MLDYLRRYPIVKEQIGLRNLQWQLNIHPYPPSSRQQIPNDHIRTTLARLAAVENRSPVVDVALPIRTLGQHLYANRFNNSTIVIGY